MKLRRPVFAALLAAVAASAQAPDTVILTAAVGPYPDTSTVYLYATASHKVTTFVHFTDVARGVLPGPDGLLYLGFWNQNALAGLDPRTGKVVTLIADPTNRILGAPYQPAVDHESVGGFGVAVLDGNLPPLPAPRNTKNLARVNVRQGTIRFDGWFPAAENDVADFFPDLFQPGSFIGIPDTFADLTVTRYGTAVNPPQALTLTTIATLPFPAGLDALWAEDGNLYLWGNSNIGLYRLDPRTGFTTLLPVQGVYAPASAAFWNEPWEKPGRRAFLLNSTDHRIYALDLAQSPVVVTATPGRLPAPVWEAPYAARSLNERELTSWWTGRRPGERNFHLHFGPAASGATALLVPSLRGLATTPLRTGGLEIYLALDGISFLALQGFLPYRPAVTLDANGEADVLWRGVGRILGISAYWQAFLLGQGGVVDASDLIHVRL